MPHKIFLSHNHFDKPVVEPVAMELAAIFGEDAVFYDSWSIRPGDHIIEEMNKGLEAPDFVFFFVSERSLASGLVKLEWQTALFKASKGKTRLVPVRVDGSEMPTILMQTVYIDMHTQGLEAAVNQIVSVSQGLSSFTQQHGQFSNLTYTSVLEADGNLTFTIRASHLMEPNPRFVFLVDNSESEVRIEDVPFNSFHGGFTRMNFAGGAKQNGLVFKPMDRPLTPKHPVVARIFKLQDAPVRLIGILHEAASNNWRIVPQAA